MMNRSLLVAIGFLLIPGTSGVAAGQGYSIRGGRVIIDRAEEWRSWSFPSDIVEITEEGRVHPRLIRRDIDAVSDRSEFGGGVLAAGSNPEDAPNILDGDLETFWEPTFEDPVEDWWVEIDLGRLVSATELTLRFSEAGDPFLQFSVLVSDGRRAFEGSQLIGYRLLGRTTRPNREERIFKYALKPAEKASEEWTGAAIQYIRIEGTDSQGDQAEEVREAEYEDLSTEDRGAILYFVEALPGELVSVTREQYEGLPAAERGPVRYHRREHPRLSEVSVPSVGDNIALGILDRGGSLDYAGIGAATSAFDGTFPNKWEISAYRPYLQNDGTLIVNLGAGFWSDAIRVIHTASTRAPLSGYVIKGSDGSKAPDGSLIWSTLTSPAREHITGRAGRFEDIFPLQKLQFLLFRNLHPRDSVWINEIQIYGRGYVPEVALTSGLIELGGSRNLTSIEWEGEMTEGTRVEIRTRTGDELDEEKHFFDKQGKEITEQRWNGLPGFSKGEVVTRHVPGPDWSGWSAPYIGSGDEMASPSPRKYAMIEARFLSDIPDRFSELDRIILNFSSPVARSVVGEISPDRHLLPGRPVELALILRPAFLPSNPGLDRIRIVAPPGVEMELLGLSVGTEEDFLQLTEETFEPGGPDGFSNASGDTLQVLGDRTGSLQIHLPYVLKAGNAKLVRIQLRSVIFLNGTTFHAAIGNAAFPDAWQRVDPGDATFLTSSRRMTVSVSVEGDVIRDVEIDPNPFTPNGDGINDTVEIEFTILKINVPRKARVTLYSLDGKQLREMSHQRPTASGRYRITWDGEDEEGKRVPPGLYLCRVEVDADSGSDQVTVIHRTICVAY